MKKSLTIILLFISSFLFGQNVFRVYLVTSGPYDYYEKDFKLSENYTNLTIEVNNDVIRVNDRVSSTYFTSDHEVYRDDYEMRVDSWDAKDEKGRNCKILLANNRRSPDRSLSVIYNDYVFNYFFK